MKKKKILFVHNSRLSHLPPFLALLDYLIETNRYDITVIAAEREEATYREYGDKIRIVNYHRGRKNGSWIEKMRIRFCQTVYYHYRLRKDLQKLSYDILWIIHVNSVVSTKSLLKDKKFIFSDYEWYDHDKMRFHASMFAAQKASVNVVCEENRAWLAKCLFKLQDLPFVLPNKPWKRYAGELSDMELMKDIQGKKVILYQGIIHRERPLDSLCEVISSLEDYCLLLLGQESSYSNNLLHKYRNVFHHGYVTPPHHLAVTRLAYIGIVVYDDRESLNCAYCAPNKIWEYSMFGIPMLYNNIPGLNYSVGAYKAGEPVELNSSKSILHAIGKIDANYEAYYKSSQMLYDSCNVGSIIDNILTKYENGNSSYC